MNFRNFAEYDQSRRSWDAVRIFRPVRYSLFTFGDSDLPYVLICGPTDERSSVSVKQGTVKISRPLIITAGNAPAEFRNFFEQQDDEDLVRFVVARSARFANMKFDNVVGSEQFVSDTVEECASRIDKRLDDEEEDRMAILTAPAGLGGVAIVRYCIERVAQSTPENVNELRERGFLPWPNSTNRGDSKA